MGHLPIRILTPASFSKYGRILVPNTEDRARNPRGRFYVLESVESEGWRMAYLEDSVRKRDALSNHTNTKETFEPIQGAFVLVVAPHDHPESIEAFLLDKPIVLNEGIWHSEPIVLSEKATIRINENLHVEGERYDLPFTITAELYTEEKPA